MKLSKQKQQEQFNIIADEVFNQGTDWKIDTTKLPKSERQYHLAAFPEAMLPNKVQCDYSKIKLEKYRDLYIGFLTEELKFRTSEHVRILLALSQVVKGA